MDIIENNSFETYSTWHDVDEVKPDDGQWVLGVNNRQIYTCKFDGGYFKQQILVGKYIELVAIDICFWADFPDEIDNL